MDPLLMIEIPGPYGETNFVAPESVTAICEAFGHSDNQGDPISVSTVLLQGGGELLAAGEPHQVRDLLAQSTENTGEQVRAYDDNKGVADVLRDKFFSGPTNQGPK